MATRKRSTPSTGTTKGPGQTFVTSYDSWGSLLDHCAKDPGPDCSYKASRETGEYRKSFSGTDNFDGALGLARNGWSEGTVKAIDFSSPIIDKVSAQLARDEYVYDFTGQCFDVARVLENEPECWMRHEEVNVDAPGRILRLVANATMPCNVPAEEIIARGATIAALVLLLERSGFRLQVDVCFASDCTQGTYESWIDLKNPAQDLDLPRLMFAMAHPAMLRRVLFSEIENNSNPALRNAMVTQGYGRCVECPIEKRGDIYIGFRSGINWTDSIAATKWLIDQLKQQGVEFSN